MPGFSKRQAPMERRAGYQGVDAGNTPRDAARTMDDLHSYAGVPAVDLEVDAIWEEILSELAASEGTLEHASAALAQVEALALRTSLDLEDARQSGSRATRPQTVPVEGGCEGSPPPTSEWPVAQPHADARPASQDFAARFPEALACTSPEENETGGASEAFTERRADGLDGQCFMKPARDAAGAQGCTECPPSTFARRSMAAAALAGPMGVETPWVAPMAYTPPSGREPDIGLVQGWVPGTHSLAALEERDPERFAAITSSAEYERLRAHIDAFDYIINNGDRHFGNLLVREGTDSLIAIDNDVSFPVRDARYDRGASTRDLDQMDLPQEVATTLSGLIAQWSQISANLSLYLTEAELESTETRLAALHAEATRRLG